MKSKNMFLIPGAFVISITSLLAMEEKRETIGDELDYKRNFHGDYDLSRGGTVRYSLSRSITSEAEVKSIWNQNSVDSIAYCGTLSIKMPSKEVDSLLLDFRSLPHAYPYLEKLKLERTTMGGTAHFAEERMKSLASVLVNNQTIKSLDLVNCVVDNNGAKLLANVLKHNTTLKELILNINLIGVEGAIDLAEALKTNTTLEKLALMGNQIGERGAHSLVMSLMMKAQNTLKELDIVSNGNINMQPHHKINVKQNLQGRGTIIRIDPQD